MAFEVDIDDPYRKRIAAKLPDVGDLTPAKPLPRVDFGSPAPQPMPLPKVNFPQPMPLPQVSFQGPQPAPLPQVNVPGIQQPAGPDPRLTPGSNLVAGRPTLTVGNMREAITSPDDLAREPTPAPAPAAPVTNQTAPGRYDLEAFRKRWMQTGDVNNIAAWLAANPDITSGVTLKNEKAYDPSGRFIADLVGNYSGAPIDQRSRIFLDGIDTGRQKQQAAKSKVREPSTGFNVGPIGGTPPGTGTPPAANNFLTQIRQLIMERLGKMSGDPSMNDPALAAQSAAYRRSRERGAQGERAAMAERAAQQGLLQGGASSGGFDTTLQGIQEGASEDVAGNDARLLGSEVSARRNEVQSLLNMALQSGDAESARVLQAQLAQLDAQLRREQMKLSDKHFGQDLGYRNRALGQQRYMYDDTMGRYINRDAEDDYRYRVNLGLGG